MIHITLPATQGEGDDCVEEAGQDDAEVQAIRWMLEELRISYFAQQLGTPYPISDKRILQAMEQLS